MRVLFFNPEQYVRFEDEPSNLELRLPVLRSGVVSEFEDFVYQRALHAGGPMEMHNRALEAVMRFRPDLVINSTSWPHESLAPSTLTEIMDFGIPVVTHVWDTHLDHHQHEADWFSSCSYFCVADSISNYLKYSILATVRDGFPYLKGVVFTAGNNVLTDVFRREPQTREHNVTLLGSVEGYRAQFLSELEQQLAGDGIAITTLGGLIHTCKESSIEPARGEWLSTEQYVRVINGSKICLSSQTQLSRDQIKGKVLQFLACGAFCLSDANREIRSLIPDDCLVYYRDARDCVEKIKYYLAHERERDRIAERGMRWFKKTFSYREFWSSFLTGVANGSNEVPAPPILERTAALEYVIARLGVDVLNVQEELHSATTKVDTLESTTVRRIMRELRRVTRRFGPKEGGGC
jgi:Glycosyl transferases group 1